MKYKVEADSPDLDDSGIDKWLNEAWDMAARKLEPCDLCRRVYNPDCDHHAEKGK